MILYPAKTIPIIAGFQTGFFITIALLFFLLFSLLQLVTWSPGGSIFKVNNLITNTTNVQFNVKWFYYLTASWKSTWIYDLRATRIPFRLIRHSINEVIIFLLYFDLVLTIHSSAWYVRSHFNRLWACDRVICSISTILFVRSVELFIYFYT